MAAHIGAKVTGDLQSAAALLERARQSSQTPAAALYAAAAGALVLLNGDGDVGAAHRLLVAAIRDNAGPYDAHDGALIAALDVLIEVCAVVGRVEKWDPFHNALGRLKPRTPFGLRLLSNAFADPVRADPAALDELSRAIASLDAEMDTTRISQISAAAVYVDGLAGCRNALWRIVDNGRAGQAVAKSIFAMARLAHDDVLMGQWSQASRLCDEALALCRTHGYRMHEFPFRHHSGMVAALRGDFAKARRSTDAILGWAIPRGAHGALPAAHQVQILSALGQGNFEAAYQNAIAVSPAGTFASHAPTALSVCMDLVEAAIRTNRTAEAKAHVDAMRDHDISRLSSRTALLAGGASAIAAPDNLAAELFQHALATPGADRWVFDLARVHLAYGERLRRTHGSTVRARTQLTSALEHFQRLGAKPWVARASSELRASGAARARSTDRSAGLTTQEHEIALLAAAGLTNKQIASKLFLSHRTVGAHLYRVYPKLGVTSRAALRDALAAIPVARAGERRN